MTNAMTFGIFFLSNRRCLNILFQQTAEQKKRMKKTTVLTEFLQSLFTLIAIYLLVFPLFAFPELIRNFLYRATSKNIYGVVLRKICAISIAVFSSIVIVLLFRYVLIPLWQLAYLNIAIKYYTSARYLAKGLIIHVNELLAAKEAIYCSGGLVGWLAHLNTVLKIVAMLFASYVSLCFFRLALDQILHIVFGRTTK